MARISRYLVPALLLICGAALTAQDEWKSLEDAKKVAATSDKPVFLVSVLDTPELADPVFKKLRSRARADEDFKVFVGARVNVFKLDPNAAQYGGTSHGTDPVLVEKYGDMSTVSVYAPGANTALWRLKAGAHKEDIFKQAREAYEKWRKEIDELEQQMKDDKELKKDPEALWKLGEAWARGGSAKRALDNLDDALKIVRKADKADRRIEKWMLRCAEVALSCEEYADAAKRFTAFLKEFRASERRNEALLGKTEAQIGANDMKGARKTLEDIKPDAPPEILDRAKKLHEKATKAAAE
ncbi:MAG: hypothetical protein IT464_09480 [Planctomycetes bacterium]|nr:hypothetical protein [Planctomycetota bacterium]